MNKLYLNKQGQVIDLDDADAVKFGFDVEEGLGPARGIVNGLIAALLIGTVVLCWWVWF